MQPRLRHSGPLGHNAVAISGSRNWTTLKSLFDVLWHVKISGNYLTDESGNGYNVLINNKDFSSNYIPSTTASTFSLPDIAGLKTDDIDNLWYTAGGVIKNVTLIDLITINNGRTLVLYDNVEPFNVRAFGLLKSTVTLTDLIKATASLEFQLWYLYFDEWNDSGFPKQNKG